MSTLTKSQQLAKQALSLIEANPQHWDQSFWHCDSTHCFAGIVELLVKGASLDEELPDDETKSVAAKALGIGDALADLWFNPDNDLPTLQAIVAGFCGEGDPCDWRVRLGMTGSPSLTAEQVASLVVDGHPDVRRAMIANPNLSPGQAAFLIGEKEVQNRA